MTNFMRELESEADPALTRTPTGVFLVTYQGGQSHCHPLQGPLRIAVRNGQEGPSYYEVTPDLARRIVAQRPPSDHQADEYPVWFAEDW